MTRQEFLKSTWSRFLKPLLIIGALAFLVRFFAYALDAESEKGSLLTSLDLDLSLAVY
jgi:hypothetical protein